MQTAFKSAVRGKISSICGIKTNERITPLKLYISNIADAVKALTKPFLNNTAPENKGPTLNNDDIAIIVNRIA